MSMGFVFYLAANVGDLVKTIGTAVALQAMASHFDVVKITFI